MSSNLLENGNIVVAVRARPLNARERSRNAASCVRMDGAQTILTPPAGARSNAATDKQGDVKRFTFDYSYWSADKTDARYASQTTLFNDLGESLIQKTLEGYNCCVMAYGQTGAGKSYSMMGTEAEPGLIPLICKALFEEIDARRSEGVFRVEVSYLEIYSERVRDLLNLKRQGALRVREHPSTGPYVEELSKLVASSYADIALLMEQGNQARTVAATAMNDASSRSHAVFSILVTQTQQVADLTTEKVAKISLVDLAGSERASSTGATGARLKEGADINKSLSTLGRVIHALVEKQASKSRQISVPYRDSVLTWLLKDSLGGNSFTAMLATISPADICWEETLSTLRYADSAKRIQTHAVVNEDPNAKMIRELRQELEELRLKMRGETPTVGDGMLTMIGADGQPMQVSKAEMVERMEQSAKLVAELNLSWEEKMRQTQQVQQERESALASLGIELDAGLIGISTPRKLPHLVNMSEDPLLTECLVYNLKPGRTRCGQMDAATDCEIKLGGASILPEHCIFDNDAGVVSVECLPGAIVLVNGLRLNGKMRLKSGYRLIIGDEALQLFRFNHPEEARQERLRSQESLPTTPSHESSSLRRSLFTPEPAIRPDSSTSSYGLSGDGHSQVTNEPVNLHALQDDELERLSSNLEQIKALRLSQRSLSSDRAGRAEQEALLQTLNAATVAQVGRDSENVAARAAQVRESVEAEILARHVLAAERRRERLTREALKKWKQLRSLALARSILDAASLVCEANALLQDTIIQLSLGPGTLASAVSPLESDAVYEKVQPARAEVQVLARIMDLNKGLVCIWTLDRLQARLAQHPTRLLEKPIPRFSLLGTAILCIPSVCDVQTQLLDVYSPHTYVHVVVLRLSLAVENVEEQRTVKLQLDSIQGLQEREATAIHTFASFEMQPERCLTSQEVSGFRDGPVVLNSRHACTVSASDLPDRMHIQVWGETTTEHVEKLLSWDDLQESSVAPVQEPAHHVAILAKVTMSELNTQGMYEAVDCLSTDSTDQGFFYLHQGLSRRISVSLSDSTGSLVPLERVTSMAISNVHLVSAASDAKRTSMSSEQVPLKLISDGKTGLRTLDNVVAQWDSSAHNTAAVDRITASGQLTCMTLTFITKDDDGNQAEWQAELKLRVFGREQQPTLLQRMFGQHRLAKVCALVFALQKGASHALKARGLSLLSGFERMQRLQQNQIELQRVMPVVNTIHARSERRPDIAEIVRYWQQKTCRRSPPDLQERLRDTKSSTVHLATVSLSGEIRRASHLSCPLHGSARKWTKTYTVARGSLLLLYASALQLDLLAVYDLFNLESFLSNEERRFSLVMKMQGQTQTLQFEATNETSARAWRQVLDSTFAAN